MLISSSEPTPPSSLFYFLLFILCLTTLSLCQTTQVGWHYDLQAVKWSGQSYLALLWEKKTVNQFVRNPTRDINPVPSKYRTTVLLYRICLSDPVSDIDTNTIHPHVIKTDHVSFIVSVCWQVSRAMPTDVGFCMTRLPYSGGGGGNKRNALFSLFNSHKWHVIFPHRQRAQQVTPSLVPSPSPTKYGHCILLAILTASVCDGPAKLTCHGSQSAAHRESLRTEQRLADWKVWQPGTSTLWKLRPALHPVKCNEVGHLQRK
jgi:hypothetical protein